MEITEFEKKRAANLIWNGAQDYKAAVGFRVYDQDGKADIYWNSIIGAIHKNYNWDELMLFYKTFQDRINQELYESLFWICLENGAFRREEKDRPVFPFLRREYAKRRLGDIYVAFDEGLNGNRASTVLKGHLRTCLGEDSGLPDLVDRKLLAELQLGPELDTTQAIEHMTATFRKYFGYYLPGEKPPKDPNKKGFSIPRLMFGRRRKGKSAPGSMGPVRALAFGYGEHAQEYGSVVLDQSHLSVAFASYTAQSDEGLKEYIIQYFGKSIYDEQTIMEMQNKYCVGNHTDVKLHFTRGEYEKPEEGSKGKNSYAEKMHQRAVQQEKKNLDAFQADLTRHKIAIEKLTARIRNSLLIYLDEQVVKSDTGNLAADRIWRGLYLEETNVFNKTLRNDMGNITVDILLDASTSQIHRTETVAAQGYMIAESLTRCHIPVRVYSFCSLNGYTVVNLYRDYHEDKKNKEIFRFFTTGANRDGLAIRLASSMIQKNNADHRILIVLSDCQPNDALKVRTFDGGVKDYASVTAVEDTAQEVHAARMEDITVLCVFTGNDDALANAKRIYNQDFARINNLEMFASTVGAMIQDRVKLLS